MLRSLLACWFAIGVSFLVGCGGGSSDSAPAAQQSAGTPDGGAAPPADMSAMMGGGDAAPEGAGGAGPDMSGMMSQYGPPDEGAAEPAGMDMSAMMSQYGRPEGDAAAGEGMDMAGMMADYAAGNYPGAGDAAAGSDGVDMQAMMADYGAQGAAGPGGEGTDPAAMMEAYGAGGYPGAPGGGQMAQKPPETLDGKAKWLFQQGRDRDAMQYWFAYALTTDAGAEILSSVRWAPALKRPALAVRTGVGFEVTGAPDGYTGDIKPLGSSQTLPQPRGRGREGGGAEGYAGGDIGMAGSDYSAMAEGGEGRGSSTNPVLARNAGELGTKMLEAFRTRLERGDYGKVLQDALADRSGAGGSGGAMGYAAGGMMDAAGGMEGMAGYGGYPGGPGGGGGQVSAADLTGTVQLLPGLTLLGVGKQKDLLDKAKAEGLDALVFFEVKLRPNYKTKVLFNDTAVMLLDVRTGARLAKTKAFNNIKFQTEEEETAALVDQEVAAFFEVVDQAFKTVDLPAALNDEAVVTKRVAALMGEKYENPLPTLGEIRMYHSKGLLDDTKLSKAYEAILGVDLGRMLATGLEEDKLKVLSHYLADDLEE